MKVLPLLLSALSLGLARAETAEEHAYNAAFNKACDLVEARYPAAEDEASTLSVLLSHRVSLARARKDPALADPNFVVRFADEIAAELEVIGQPVAKAGVATELVPTPAYRKATLTLKEYQGMVERGELGTNPKLQMRARAGDPYAQAEVERQQAFNRLQAQINASEISEAAAAAERQRIETAYQGAIQSIQLDQLTAELERITRELERRRAQR